MKLSDVDLLRLEMKRGDILTTEGFIDELQIVEDPRLSRMRLLIRREYRRCCENMELADGREPWIKWRQAMQGCE